MLSQHPVYQKLLKQKEISKNCLCIGLDPDLEKIPSNYPKNPEGALAFLLDIVTITQNHCIAYKPNISFFEAMGLEGLHILKTLCEKIPSQIPIIIDAKRGDIGNTSRMQASFIFNTFRADGITVNPLMGYDSVKPFLDHSDKLVFLLGLTSNPGSADIERQVLQSGKTVYEHTIALANTWAIQHPNIGLVVGATHDELPIIRNTTTTPFLIPGVGAQGGTYQHALQGADKHGICLINVGRDILYAENTKPTTEAVLARIQKIV